MIAKSLFFFLVFGVLVPGARSQETAKNPDLVYLGTFHDYRGREGSFFVEPSRGDIHGPVIARGTDKLDRYALGELQRLPGVAEWTFKPSGQKARLLTLAPSIGDPFVLGLLTNDPQGEELFFARVQRLSASLGQERALYGLLVAGRMERVRALLAHEFLHRTDLRLYAHLYMEGLQGLAHLNPCTQSSPCHPFYVLLPCARAKRAGKSEQEMRRKLYEGMVGVNVFQPLLGQPLPEQGSFYAGALHFEDLLHAKEPLFYAWLKRETEDLTSYTRAYLLGLRQKGDRDYLVIAYGTNWTDPQAVKLDRATLLEIPWEFGAAMPLDFGTGIQFVLRQGKEMPEYRFLKGDEPFLLERLTHESTNQPGVTLGFLARLAGRGSPAFTWAKWHELARRESLERVENGFRDLLTISPDIATSKEVEKYVNLTPAGSLWTAVIYLWREDFTGVRRVLKPREGSRALSAEQQNIREALLILSQNFEKKRAFPIPKEISPNQAAKDFQSFVRPLPSTVQAKWQISLQASGFRF